MGIEHQAKLIKFLIDSGWVAEGYTRSETYKIITQNSYPLAGGIVTIGGKPRFIKDGWWVAVGVRTTVIYKKPDKPETMKGTGRLAGRDVYTFKDWETYNINTKEVDEVKGKLIQLGLGGKG